MTKWVTLWRNPQTPGDSDGYDEPLDPPGVWAQLQPLPPQDDGRMRGHLVTIRFHKGVTVDSHLVYYDPVLLRNRTLFVKGVQNVDEKGAEMRLYCEEVWP